MARAPAVQDAEALPEADRLEPFPHPRNTRTLFGHEAAESELADAFVAGRMHHAWLLAGPEGIGKATLAYRLARFVLAVPAERDASAHGLDIAPQSVAARQVAALSHPGLLVLRRPYDLRAKRLAGGIPVDEVRRLKMFLGLTAGEGAWRVVIVDSANDLNVNAANALLKALEEPPSRAMFLLVSSEPSRLLATIRSRSRRLDLAPLDASALRPAVTAAMAAAGSEPPQGDAWQRMERLAKGSVRRALQLAGSGGLEVHERVEAILRMLPKVDWIAAHTLADQLALAANEQRLEAFYDLLLEALAGLVRAGAGHPDAADEDRALARRLVPPHRAGAWAALWEDIVREKGQSQALNLDRKALVLATIGRLEVAAAGS